MLSHYIELAANKQRLKVWFAESALAGDILEVTKNNLLEKMPQSLRELQKLASRCGAVSKWHELRIICSTAFITQIRAA